MSQAPVDPTGAPAAVGGPPCADSHLLVPLKRSAPYGQLRPRVAQLLPVDSWQEDELHFFVFQLRPVESGSAGRSPSAPVAVFTMHPTAAQPVAAVVVTPLPDGQQAEISDLLQRAEPYRVALADITDLVG